MGRATITTIVSEVDINFGLVRGKPMFRCDQGDLLGRLVPNENDNQVWLKEGNSNLTLQP